MQHKKPKYNIGDLIIIVYVDKIGVITNIKNSRYICQYEIYWTYKDGDVETSLVDEKTIDMWFSKTEGKARDNLNQYHKVPV